MFFLLACMHMYHAASTHVLYVPDPIPKGDGSKIRGSDYHEFKGK